MNGICFHMREGRGESPGMKLWVFLVKIKSEILKWDKKGRTLKFINQTNSSVVGSLFEPLD